METARTPGISNDTVLSRENALGNNQNNEKGGLRTTDDGEDHEHEPPVRNYIEKHAGVLTI
jgi:hypothetical protein